MRFAGTLAIGYSDHTWSEMKVEADVDPPEGLGADFLTPEQPEGLDIERALVVKGEDILNENGIVSSFVCCISYEPIEEEESK